VSEVLQQQINLYQPRLRRQELIFSAATILQSVAVIAVALMTVYGFSLVQTARLESQAGELERLEQAKSVQLASVDTTSGPARRAAIEAELAALNQRLAEQQKIVELLQDKPPGSTQGFSRYLSALARQRHPGVWLTSISVNGTQEALELRGQSFDAQRVPEYLAALTREAALNGQRFDDFLIYRTDNRDVRFHVSSKAAAERTVTQQELLQ
jgi:Tfp pilus assembly protein PilN